MKNEANLLLGVDWGTSNRRAYLVDGHGACLAKHADDQGMLAVGGRFAESLAALRSAMHIDAGVPAVLSGMVGSAGGWQEVPYVDSAVALADLPGKLAPVHGQPGCSIVPGYCYRGDTVDVMRGEETQLLGAGVRDGWVVLPGTHSKWVLLRDGAIARFSTFMTGELFAMLAAGGTLSAIMQPGPDDGGAFRAGMAQARLGKPLTNSLFGVRARVVAGAMQAAQARSFVSGLLIGTEFAAATEGGDVFIIGSPALGERYAEAAAQFGMAAQVLDPDTVYLAALNHLYQKAAS